MPRYRLVIFDFDGTLADSAPWFGSVINGVARRFGFREVGPAEMEALRHLNARSVLRELGVSAWKLPLIARHMRGLQARDAAQIRLFPGTAELLRRLDEAGAVIAIVSSNREANIRTILGPELASRVRHFGCDASLLGKAPKLRRVLREAGVSPAAALAIGDEARDHAAALEVGIAFGAVTWGYGAPATLIALRPDFVFEDMDKISELVGNQALMAS